MKVKSFNDFVNEEAVNEAKKEILVANSRTKLNFTKPEKNEYFDGFDIFLLLKQDGYGGKSDKYMVLAGPGKLSDYKGTIKEFDRMVTLPISDRGRSKGTWKLAEVVKKKDIEKLTEYTKGARLYVFQ